MCSCEGNSDIPQCWAEVNENGTVETLSPLLNSNMKGLLGVADNYDKVNNPIDYWFGAEHMGGVLSGLNSLDFPKAKWVVVEVYGSALALAPTTMPEGWQHILLK